MQRIGSGSPYEDEYGFSRAIRVGSQVYVAGTGPIWPDGTCSPDAEEQADRCFAIIGAALDEAGASLDEVVRTRMYITDRSLAPAVGRAHARAGGQARPVTTIVVIDGLVDPRWVVEIEAEAVDG